MVNQFYDLCVVLLIWSAGLMGISYEEINILLFVVLQPLLIVLFFVLWILAALKLRQTTSTLRGLKSSKP